MHNTELILLVNNIIKTIINREMIRTNYIFCLEVARKLANIFGILLEMMKCGTTEI